MLSGNVEENHGPFTQIDNDKTVPCTKQVNSVSLLESRLSEHDRISVNVHLYWEMETVFSVQSHVRYITLTMRIICIYTLGVQHVLHHPELYINPVNTYRQTQNIYIGHIQECHCKSTMPVLNSNTYEMTCGNEPITKSASSNKSKLKQCKQRQFSQDKHAQLASRDKENCFIVAKNSNFFITIYDGKS